MIAAGNPLDLEQYDTDALIARAVLLLLVALVLQHDRTRRIFVSFVARLRIRSLKPENGPSKATVSALYIHPVKSLRAVSVLDARVDDRGLAGDRRFMLVTPSPPNLFGTPDATYKFLTQRQAPDLATVAAHIDGPILTLSRNQESVAIEVGKVDSSTRYTARVWTDIVDVVDVGDEAATFLQSIISDVKGVRLVAMVGDRAIDVNFTPPETRSWLGNVPQTALNDGFPILVGFEASLEELNRRLKEKGKAPITMSRFRPNIVIRGTTPFEEDTWKVIQIGDTVMSFVKGCPRCKQSCTDQLTGKVHDEPVATLSDFRALGTNKDDVFFAQNAVPHKVGTTVQVGNTVLVLKRGKPVWDKDSKGNL